MHLEVNLSDIWKINIFLFKFLQIGKNNSTPQKEFKMESIQLDSVWNKKIPFPTAIRSVISNLVLISTDYLKICIRNKFTYIEIQIPSCFISVLKNETKPTLYSNYWISLFNFQNAKNEIERSCLRIHTDSCFIRNNAQHQLYHEVYP